ncbi:type 3 dihydrofolate reductase [Candidatus Schneideria nysicola]|uniref:type 3 dihydrofolate reductase n=1 Tax=Candidatus Schneideria nysicola TaxID=1081631 RepID=UPI001CAA6949|nr:type 3 dihydrofolate reductase [Candidatus Schneideria nysicola]UAJ65584.1 type 3 dihydrofolate reductase [Candidatus Schneideria nysicola]
MNISLIASLTPNHTIGINNTIPWYLPVDRGWFKKHTINKPIIMGRKTFDSIGRIPLPNRYNIVISRYINKKNNFLFDDCRKNIEWVTDINQALDKVNNIPEIMIIGGGEIYREFLGIANRLYLTYVYTDIEGNIKFPNYEKISNWKIIFNKINYFNNRNKYTCCFKILERCGVNNI